MGFPHATSTAVESSSELNLQRAPAASDASVHLTLGISVADCGLTYGTLRGQLLLELERSPASPEEYLSDDDFWSLYEPLRIGCLAPAETENQESELPELLTEHLVSLVMRLDFNVLADFDELTLHAAARRVVDRWLQIWRDLLVIYDQGYSEVVNAAGE